MKDSDKPMLLFLMVTFILGCLTWIGIGGFFCYWIYGLILKTIS